MPTCVSDSGVRRTKLSRVFPLDGGEVPHFALLMEVQTRANSELCQMDSGLVVVRGTTDVKKQDQRPAAGTSCMHMAPREAH